MNLHTWRSETLATLSRSEDVSSLNINGVPHRNTVQNCDLLAILPHNATLLAEIRAYAQKFGAQDEEGDYWIAAEEVSSQHVLSWMQHAKGAME
jgi:hypothetical protein